MNPLYIFGLMAVGGCLLPVLIGTLLRAEDRVARWLRLSDRWSAPHPVFLGARPWRPVPGLAASASRVRGRAARHAGEGHETINGRARDGRVLRSAPLSWDDLVANVVGDNRAIQREVERVRCVPPKDGRACADEQRIESIIGDYAALVAARVGDEAPDVMRGRDDRCETALVSRWAHDMHTLRVLRDVLHRATTHPGAEE